MLLKKISKLFRLKIITFIILIFVWMVVVVILIRN